LIVGRALVAFGVAAIIPGGVFPAAEAARGSAPPYRAEALDPLGGRPPDRARKPSPSEAANEVYRRLRGGPHWSYTSPHRYPKSIRLQSEGLEEVERHLREFAVFDLEALEAAEDRLQQELLAAATPGKGPETSDQSTSVWPAVEDVQVLSCLLFAVPKHRIWPWVELEDGRLRLAAYPGGHHLFGARLRYNRARYGLRREPAVPVAEHLAVPASRVLYSAAVPMQPTRSRAPHGIWSMKPDGSRRRPLTQGRSLDCDPVRLPDGRILFARLHAGEEDGLYVMNADGAGLHRLTPPGVRALSPSPSPEGLRVAFTRVERDPQEGPGRRPRFWVETIDLDGRNLLRLQEGWRPSWSPVGHNILFTQPTPDCQATLAIMDVMGGDARSLTVPSPPSDLEGAWSPDGRRIAFTWRGDDGPPKLWVMESTGRAKRRLTQGDAAEYGPTWSADGRYVYFTRAAVAPDQGADVWRFDLVRRRERRLTRHGSAFSGAAFGFAAARALQTPASSGDP
jgi:hypothetical protein